MTEIVAAILYNLRSLARFSGRDTRTQFWPYAIFLFILQMVASTIIMIPVMYRVMSQTFEFIQRHPVNLDDPSNAVFQKELAQIIDVIFSDMQTTLTITTPILTAAFIVLIAAAIARRLHDRNRPGFWGLMPLPFTAFGLAALPIILPGIWRHTLSIAWWAALLLNNLLYWVALILLIVQLAQRSSSGPNRFGPGAPDWRSLR